MKPSAPRSLVLLLLLVLLASAAPGVSAQGSPPPLDTEAIDAYIARAMELLPIPGIALGIVQDGQVVYEKTYGVAGPGGRPVTPQTVFVLGSVGKCWTALAIMQLANQGLVELDAPVQRYLPEFHTADAESSARITITQLLNHRSGFSRAQGTAPQAYDPNKSLDELVSWLANIDLAYTPGSIEEYSNLNYVLLTAVVEQVSGQTYDEYVRENILAPLGMTHSYTTLEEASRNGLAQHYRNMFGLAVPYAAHAHIPAHVGAGFVYTSLEDMLHFSMPYFDEGRYGSTRVMTPVGKTSGEGWLDVYWQWHSGTGKGVEIGHEGGTNSANTSMLRPEIRTGVVLLMNTRYVPLTGTPPTAGTLAAGVMGIVMGKIVPPPGDGGLHAYYLRMNLAAGALLLLGAWELGSSLTLWPRWLANPGRKRRIVFYALLGLESAAALLYLVGGALFQGINWVEVFRYASDYPMALVLVALLLLGAGAAKAVAARRL